MNCDGNTAVSSDGLLLQDLPQVDGLQVGMRLCIKQGLDLHPRRTSKHKSVALYNHLYLVEHLKYPQWPPQSIRVYLLLLKSLKANNYWQIDRVS